MLISELLTLGERGAGKGILTAYYGGHAHVEETGEVFLHAFGQVVRTSGVRRVGFQPVTVHCLEKCSVPDLHDMRAESAAQISDFMMPLLF